MPRLHKTRLFVLCELADATGSQTWAVASTTESRDGTIVIGRQVPIGGDANDAFMIVAALNARIGEDDRLDINLTRQIVDKLLKDLSDRRGFDNEWDQIDDDVRSEIRRTWAKIIEDYFVEN